MKQRSLSRSPSRVLRAVGSILAVLPAAVLAGSPAWLTSRDAEIKALIATMTLEEKVGQMTQPDSGALRDPADIKNLFLGSVLSGGTSDPKSGNTLEDWTAMVGSFHDQALATRLKIPLLYGIDAVHGHSNVLGAVIFPHQIGMGCTRNPDIVREASRITALETRATGIQWTFAPCITVPRDIRWGRTYEGYSQDPDIVRVLGEAATLGLQGDRLGAAVSVVACAKHYVGDGGTAYGSAKAGGVLDQGDTRTDEATLRAVHMAGYPAAIAAGVGTIMPSYSSWNGVKCSGNKYLLTDVLKKELGFEGFLISDYNAIDQLVPPAEETSGLAGNNAAGQVTTPDYKKCIEISINAGMDMVMVTNRYPEFIRLLQELVKEGKVPMERVDDAVLRILRVKCAAGLMDKDGSDAPEPGLKEAFGSPAHRAVARQAVRESVVLLKNGDGKPLPLSKSAGQIHVAGRGADDLGMQCGGWTIDWQGKLGPVTPGGTTILAALRATAGKETRITHSVDGSGADGSDVAVLVIGEAPYAEMHGDRESLDLDPADVAAFRKLKASGVPVVVVLLSGRPLILGEVADQADAIVAAWLPGTEGQGVVDVLFGDFKPTGKLSFTWPGSIDELPNGKTGGISSLYKLGHGLTY